MVNMYYLLEDNRIFDSENLREDLSSGTPLAIEFDISKERNEIHFYFLGIHFEALKIKKQSESVFDLIEKGDLITVDRAKIYSDFYAEPIIETSQVFWSDSHHSLCVYTRGNGYYCPIISFGVQKGILAIYKPNSKGDYIKVWEKKNEN